MVVNLGPIQDYVIDVFNFHPPPPPQTSKVANILLHSLQPNICFVENVRVQCWIKTWYINSWPCKRLALAQVSFLTSIFTGMTVVMIAVVEFSQFWWNLGEAAHSSASQHLPLRELASSYCFRQEHRLQNKQSSVTHHWSFTLRSNYVDLFWFEQIRE